MSDTRQALRVIMEGAVTSFRYPHFMLGVQPTYDFPPPSTLYGHVCSVLGELVSPESFRVALHFTHQGRFKDYEHLHLIHKKEALKLSPYDRELLFKPRLVLYIDRPDWYAAMRRPRYMTTLGRSQDLMCYREVRVVTLHRVPQAYMEHTIIPLSQSGALSQHKALTMPQFIDNDRTPYWQAYATVDAPQVWPTDAWVDPDAPTWRALSRAVHWLDFGQGA